jgi:predicted RNA-binding protein YlqC (UPF0109 family)
MEKYPVTITLLVPVYNGGSYWEECAKNIKKFGHLFDNIIISINKGDLYRVDREVAEGIGLDNLEVKIQNKMLGAVSHFDNIIRCVKTDYVVILAHDDLLLDGIGYLRENLELAGPGRDVAFLGTFTFFKGSEEIAQVKEICDGCMTKVEFIEYDLAKHFNLNISGMCLPVKSLLDNLEYFNNFISGIRYDYLLLTNNRISKICQLDDPTVKIRVHDNQQGKIIASKGRAVDSILFFMYHIIETNDEILKRKLIDQLAGTMLMAIKTRTFYGIFFYIKKFPFFINKMGLLSFFSLNYNLFYKVLRKVFSKIRGFFK